MRPGSLVADGASLPGDIEIEGSAWIGRDVQIGGGVRLIGPIVLGDGARVGDGAHAAREDPAPRHRDRRGVDPDRRDRRSRRILASLRRPTQVRRGGCASLDARRRRC